jgi:hypothetical protein
MLSRIKATFARLRRPRRRRAPEHGWHSQGEAQRYRADQIGETARGHSYGTPEAPWAP